MSDNTTLPGTGETVRDKDRTGVKTQIIGIDLAPGGSETLMNGVMPVSDNGGSLTVDNGGTFAVQADTELTTADLDTGGGTDTRAVVGLALAASGGAVLAGTANPVPVSDNGGSLTVDGTVAVSGTVPITDNAGSLTVDAPVGTPVFVRLSDGTTAIATLPVSLATLPALTAGSAAIGKLAANSGVDIGDVDVTSLPGALAGVADDAAFTVGTTPVLPVGFLADQASTDSVNEGDVGAARMTLDRKQVVTLGPSGDTEGLSTFHLVSVGSTNATVVKNGAGKLHRWYVYNANANARKVAFHNSGSTPTAGASVAWSMVIPGGSAANDSDEIGIGFSAGIAITTVTEVADSGSTGVASGDLVINLFYA